MRRTSFVALLVVGALLVPLAVFASHRFNDVPDGHTFHNAIDWMEDNDITVGCNPPANTEFCPDENVTRGQMAAFMKRLAENTVVDALTLRGQGASVFQSPVWGSSLDVFTDGVQEVTGSGTAGTNLLSLPVAPLSDGILAITYSVGIGADFSFEGRVWLQYDNSSCNLATNAIPASASFFAGSGGLQDGNRQLSVTIAKSTTAGSHTLFLCGSTSGANTFARHNASIVAVYSAVGIADQ
jgi:hypothetical protein